MNRNAVTVLVAALVIALGTVSYLLYAEKQKTSGVEISVGDGKLQIEKK